MTFVHHIFTVMPVIALMLSIGIGSWLGSIKFGQFKLGGTAGSLLVAVAISQFGVTLDPSVKTLVFSLFIYAVGFQSGPKFFASLNKSALKEIILAVFMAVSGLATVLACAKIFHLGKGFAAGIAAGGMTQSSIIGTAGDAIADLGLSVNEVLRLQDNLAVGYAISYIFGALLVILMSTDLLEVMFKRSIRSDAVELEIAQNRNLRTRMFTEEHQHVIQDVIADVVELKSVAAEQTVDEFEKKYHYDITIKKIKRGNELIKVSGEKVLQEGDLLLILGVRESVLECLQQTGELVADIPADMDCVFTKSRVVFTNKNIAEQTWRGFSQMRSGKRLHGVYVVDITRTGRVLPLSDNTIIKHGDILEVYGSAGDIHNAAQDIGYAVTRTVKTDCCYLGLGMVLGLLVGMIEVKFKGVLITLGAGGGALLGGLVFGWLHARRPNAGYFPVGALEFLKSFGLMAFLAAVGLSAGLEALQTLRNSGAEVFFAGLVVAIVPFMLTTIFGWYVLRYRNLALFAGALAGSHSADPALGAVLEKAGNATPATTFIITYAVANIILTLLGPLIISLV